MRAAPALGSATRAPRQGRTWPRALTALHAHVRGGAIDRELARGVPSWRSPVHAARSLQVTSVRSRAALAHSLEDLVKRAGLPRSHLFGSAVVEPCRVQVWHALPQIRELTTRLRGREPIASRGAATLLELLRDGTGPCYNYTHDGALSAVLDRVAAWLGHRGVTYAAWSAPRHRAGSGAPARRPAAVGRR